MDDVIGDTEDGDVELVHRGVAGDHLAFEALYRRYAPIVAATARRLLRDRHDVEDIVQETFMIAFEQLRTLIDPAALRGWICRIAVSRAHRRFRRRRLAQAGDPHADAPAPATSPERHAELALIARALDMPVELRRAWVLRHVLDAPLEDVAAACGCSLATVKRRLAEASALVSEHVQQTPRARRRAAHGTNARGFLIPLEQALSES